jgi:hypothetical protein
MDQYTETKTEAIKERVVDAMDKMSFEDLEFLDNMVDGLDGYRLFFHVLNSNKL